ncbi:hypothetical protein FV227_22750 [Methylobacterium sp. WL119]|uniref:hypothetical protein n=1 Tax=Methylobacterium sp. WL119 TaxID=2603888 RepID=UPI0011C8556D|nr:hypothetical protein [Methylobacterium sp. WL119]TXN46786.1 hypothetical protein FV227_22750 [Methylobacterium sp. WL119]
MSATVIPLKRRYKPPLTNIRSDAVEKELTADAASAFHDGTRVRLLLDGLRAQQDTLLSAIENLRAPSLRAHPDLGRHTAALEAASIQALAEIGLLIRCSTELLRRLDNTSVQKLK